MLTIVYAATDMLATSQLNILILFAGSQRSWVFSQPYNDSTFQTSSFCCLPCINQQSKSIEISDDLFTKFCQWFDLFAVMRLFKLSSLRIMHHTLGKLSLTLIIIFMCCWKLVSLRLICLNLSKYTNGFGSTPFCANFIDNVEYDIDVKGISSLRKLLVLVGHYTSSLQLMMAYFMSLPIPTIFHDLIFGSLVLKLITSFIVDLVNGMVTKLLCISSNNLIFYLTCHQN